MPASSFHSRRSESSPASELETRFFRVSSIHTVSHDGKYRTQASSQCTYTAASKGLLGTSSLGQWKTSMRPLSSAETRWCFAHRGTQINQCPWRTSQFISPLGMTSLGKWRTQMRPLSSTEMQWGGNLWEHLWSKHSP